ARFIRSMFCTSLRSPRCFRRRRKAAASNSVCCSLLISVIVSISIGSGAGGEYLICVQCLLGIQPAEDRGEAVDPSGNAHLVADLVLANLDEGVRDAGFHAMAEHGVAAQRPV